VSENQHSRYPQEFQWNTNLLKNRYDQLALPGILIVYVALWALVKAIFSANLDRYADMLEGFAWGQVFSWGSFKHPPLVGWIAGSWFSIFPTNDQLYFLLSYLIAAGGLLGVFRLSMAAGLGRLSIAVVLLQMCALPYTTLAGKFNANSILLLAWPWVVLIWWKCIHLSGSTYTNSLFLGLCAALAMLGKYYSGVLLLALGIVTVISEPGRQWLKTPKPWFALVVFFIALLPHISWLQSHEFITFKYVGDQGGGGISWTNLIKFLLAPLIYWGVALLICVGLFGNRRIGWLSRIWLAWQPAGWRDYLFWVVMLPYVLTLLFGLSGFVELSLPWSIPIGFGFPILWLRNLTQRDALHDQAVMNSRTLGRWLIIMVLIVLVGAGIDRVRATMTKEDIVYLPRREAAREMLARWDSSGKPERPAWVAGIWAENASVAFYGDKKIKVLPGFPDQPPATLDDSLSRIWEDKYGLIYCPPVAGASELQESCEQDAREWLTSHELPIDEVEFVAHRSGWTFPDPKRYRYVGFMVAPKEQ